MVKFNSGKIILDEQDLEKLIESFTKDACKEEFGEKTAGELELEHKARVALGKYFGQIAADTYSKPDVQNELKEHLNNYLAKVRKEIGFFAYYFGSDIKNVKRELEKSLEPQEIIKQQIYSWTVNEKKKFAKLKAPVDLAIIFGQGNRLQNIMNMTDAQVELGHLIDKRYEIVQKLMQKIYSSKESGEKQIKEAIIDVFPTPADFICYFDDYVTSTARFFDVLETALRGENHGLLSGGVNVAKDLVHKFAIDGAKKIYGLSEDMPLERYM
jgi:hypothetical protein